MAFAPLEKIKSLLKIPSAYAAESEETARADETERNGEPDGIASEADAAVRAERDADAESSDESPAESLAAVSGEPAETSEAPSEELLEKPLEEPAAEYVSSPPETEAAPDAAVSAAGLTDPGVDVSEADASNADAAREPASPDASVSAPDAAQDADVVASDAVAPDLAGDAAPGDATPAPGDATAFADDEDRQKLHDKALRFANGKTGLLGFMRRLRGAIAVVAALAAKPFVRFKKFGPKPKVEKFDASNGAGRASTSAKGDVYPAEPGADALQTGEESASARDISSSEASAKKKKTPFAKNAKIKMTALKKSADDASAETAPVDKAAAKKAKEKEKAAAKKAKDNEKKAAKKAKDEAKKAAKLAKEEAKKAIKEAKEAAFAEKYPKKAAKRAEQAAKKEARKASKEAKKKAGPDKNAIKAAKAAAKAAKKAKKEENKKPKLTKEEKYQLKLEKQAAKHEKKIETFERKARKIEQKLEKKHEKKAAVQEVKNEKKAVKKERKRIRKGRKLEIKKQKKYWLERGVGRAKRNASILLLVVLILSAFVTGTTFLYKSEAVNIPILNKAVQIVADSPVMDVVKFLEKPARVAIKYAAIPVSYVIKLIKGEPKIEDMYFFEADKMERYEAFREANPDMPSDEVVWRVNAGVDLPLYRDTVAISDFGKRPILINKFHNLPEDYEPQGMVRISENSQMRADPEASAALARLREAAALENLDIEVASAYRSHEYQSLIYNPMVSDTRERLENFLSRPGFSENQSGLAFDLSVGGGRMYDFAGTPEAAWVAKNAENFGFILRYPEGFEDVTGVPYQPWHIRYVGDEVIETMRENDIETLEEYCVKFLDHKPGDEPEKPMGHGGMTESADGPI